jgi:ABC-type proline/glycine betaine transport system permease subunit
VNWQGSWAKPFINHLKFLWVQKMMIAALTGVAIGILIAPERQ